MHVMLPLDAYASFPRRVAVRVYAVCRPDHTMEFNQPNSHHHQVGHHVFAAKEGEQGLHKVGELARAAGDDFLVHRLGFHAPLSVS